VYVQTHRVSQTKMFRNRKIGGKLCTKHRKNSVVPIPDEHYDRNKTFFQHFVLNLKKPRILCSETRNMTRLYSKDVSSGQPDFRSLVVKNVNFINIKIKRALQHDLYLCHIVNANRIVKNMNILV
jgi:hypothetical protein